MKTDDYLWHKFETAIDERFLSGGTMPEVEADYQPLADAMSHFWQYASRPPLRAMMMLALHPLFAKNPYQANTKDDCVLVSVSPGTKWFNLDIAIHPRGIIVTVKGDSHAAYSKGIHFNRRELNGEGAELLKWWHETHPGDYMELADGVKYTAIPDYLMILYALVAYGVDACQNLEQAITATINELEQKDTTLTTEDL